MPLDINEIKELSEHWNKLLNFENSHYVLMYAVLPHECRITGRMIWPGTQHYIKIINHMFDSYPQRYEWIHKDEFVFLRLKGEI